MRYGTMVCGRRAPCPAGRRLQAIAVAAGPSFPAARGARLGHRGEPAGAHAGIPSSAVEPPLDRITSYPTQCLPTDVSSVCGRVPLSPTGSGSPPRRRGRSARPGRGRWPTSTPAPCARTRIPTASHPRALARHGGVVTRYPTPAAAARGVSGMPRFGRPKEMLSERQPR